MVDTTSYQPAVRTSCSQDKPLTALHRRVPPDTRLTINTGRSRAAASVSGSSWNFYHAAIGLGNPVVDRVTVRLDVSQNYPEGYSSLLYRSSAALSARTVTRERTTVRAPYTGCSAACCSLRLLRCVLEFEGCQASSVFWCTAQMRSGSHYDHRLIIRPTSHN
jgi:hypothetical protein